MAALPVQNLFVRVIQPGRSRMVPVHVVLPADWPVNGLPMLDSLCKTTLDRLQQAHPATALDMVFTAYPLWARPSAGIPSKPQSRNSACASI